MILGDIIDRNARCVRDHPAFVFEGRCVTHGTFAERVRRLGNALLELGLGRGDRIAILAQNCPEYMEVYGAAGMCGFVAVGLNYRLAAADQAAILRDCSPAVLVFDPVYEDRVQELRDALPAGVTTLKLGPDAGPGG